MSLIMNGTEVPDDGAVAYNGTNLEKVMCDGITVWEKVVFQYKDFVYTGQIEPWVVPVDGTYKLEAWGAQGGTSYDRLYDEVTGIGGLGGYACGYEILHKGTTIYVCVGQSGRDDNAAFGAFNGGRTGEYGTHVDHVSYSTHCVGRGGGGGATTISTFNGSLKGALPGISYDAINRAVVDGCYIIAGGGGGGFMSSEPDENGESDEYSETTGTEAELVGGYFYGDDPHLTHTDYDEDDNPEIYTAFGAGGTQAMFNGAGAGYKSGVSRYLGGSNWYKNNQVIVAGVTYRPTGSYSVQSGDGKARITLLMKS